MLTPFSPRRHRLARKGPRQAHRGAHGARLRCCSQRVRRRPDRRTPGFKGRRSRPELDMRRMPEALPKPSTGRVPRLQIRPRAICRIDRGNRPADGRGKEAEACRAEGEDEGEAREDVPARQGGPKAQRGKRPSPHPKYIPPPLHILLSPIF